MYISASIYPPPPYRVAGAICYKHSALIHTSLKRKVYTIPDSSNLTKFYESFLLLLPMVLLANSLAAYNGRYVNHSSSYGIR